MPNTVFEYAGNLSSINFIWCFYSHFSKEACKTGFIINATFWAHCYLAFPNPCDAVRWLLHETGCHTPQSSGPCSCLLSTRPSVPARTHRDDSLALSNFGEIPCLLYLNITEAKRTVGQQIGGRSLRH